MAGERDGIGGIRAKFFDSGGAIFEQESIRVVSGLQDEKSDLETNLQGDWQEPKRSPLTGFIPVEQAVDDGLVAPQERQLGICYPSPLWCD